MSGERILSRSRGWRDSDRRRNEALERIGAGLEAIAVAMRDVGELLAATQTTPPPPPAAEPADDWPVGETQ